MDEKTTELIENLVPEKLHNLQMIFQFCPEVSKLFGGDLELFDRYLNGIFPESKIRDALFHSSPEEQIDEPKVVNFNSEIGKDLYGFYMSNKPNGIYGQNVHPVMVNVKNGKEVDAMTIVAFTQEDYLRLKNESVDIVYAARTNNEKYDYSEIVVFEAEKIHVIGSKTDTEMTKKFLASQ